MTTTWWAASWRRLEAPTTCRPATSWRRLVGQDGPKPMNLAAWGPGWGPGPQGGPRGPPWSPMATHTPRCPAFGPDDFRWPFRTTICMAKEMWFLRLLLEWPGFPTLLYSVILCTAQYNCSFSAWGVSFHRIIVLGKQNIFKNIHSFFKTTPK